MGKGSVPRPIPNRKRFEENWDLAFGQKSKTPTLDALRERVKKDEEKNRNDQS